MRDGIQRSTNRFRTPIDQICLGITYLIEREFGHDAQPYADAIKSFWADGQVLARDGSGHFGYHAMVYDWIYDAMSPDERQRFGNCTWTVAAMVHRHAGNHVEEWSLVVQPDVGSGTPEHAEHA